MHKNNAASNKRLQRTRHERASLVSCVGEPLKRKSSVATYPCTIMGEFWADISIHLLPSESGGRTESLDLCNDRPGQYRPHLRVIDGSGEMLGVAVMDGPDDPLKPGDCTQATIKSLYEPNVTYDELVEGARFEILEGPNVVGYGEIVRRLS